MLIVDSDCFSLACRTPQARADEASMSAAATSSGAGDHRLCLQMTTHLAWRSTLSLVKCDEKTNEQQWEFSKRTGEMKTAFDNKCVTAKFKQPAENGLPLRLDECQNVPGQRWEPLSTTGQLRLAGGTSQCLQRSEVSGSPTLTTWSCHDGSVTPGQHWMIVNPEDLKLPTPTPTLIPTLHDYPRPDPYAIPKPP